MLTSQLRVNNCRHCTRTESRIINCMLRRSKHLIMGAHRQKSSEFKGCPGIQRLSRLQSRARGARIALVGGGKGTRAPLSKIIGLYSSGTESCITGLFRYRSMFAPKPWFGSHQLTEHAFRVGTEKFE